MRERKETEGMSGNHYHPGAGHGAHSPSPGGAGAAGAKQPGAWGVAPGRFSPAQGGQVAPGWTPLPTNGAPPPRRSKRGPVLVLVLMACVVCVVIGVLVYLHSAGTDSASTGESASYPDSPTWEVAGEVIDAHAPLIPSSDWLRGQEMAWQIPAPDNTGSDKTGSRFGRGSLVVTDHRLADLGVSLRGWDVSGDEPQLLWERTYDSKSAVVLSMREAFWVGDTLIAGNAIVNARTGDVVLPTWLGLGVRETHLAIAGDTIITCDQVMTAEPGKCAGHGFDGKLRWEAEAPEGKFYEFEHIADPAGLRSVGYKVTTSDTDDRSKALYAIDVATGTFTKVREYSADQCSFRTLIDGWAFACFDDATVSLYDHTGALVDSIVPSEPPLQLSASAAAPQYVGDYGCYTNAVPFWNHDPRLDDLRAYYRDGDDTNTEGALAYSGDCRTFTYREPGSGGATHSFEVRGIANYWVTEYDGQPASIPLPLRVSEDHKLLVVRWYLYFDVDGGEFLDDIFSINKSYFGDTVMTPEPNLILGSGEEGDVLGYRPSK